jgi:hypothetical protein
MLAAGRLVAVLPCVQSKQFAAVQAADEARHVEVFPIDSGSKGLMEQGLTGSIWDMVVLTTLVLIEGADNFV